MRTAHQLIVENDDIAVTLEAPCQTSRIDVIGEICHHLAPFQASDRPIVGETVIAKDLTIDSLAIMDMVMELEDRYGISVSEKEASEIVTVKDAVDFVLAKAGP